MNHVSRAASSYGLYWSVQTLLHEQLHVWNVFCFFNLCIIWSNTKTEEVIGAFSCSAKALALVFSWMQGGVCQALHVKITTSVLKHYTCIPLPVWLLWPNSVLLGLTLTVVDCSSSLCWIVVFSVHCVSVPLFADLNTVSEQAPDQLAAYAQAIDGAAHSSSLQLNERYFLGESDCPCHLALHLNERYFLSESDSNSKHWFTTSFLQPLPYLVTP